jgi:hypothetical protein
MRIPTKISPLTSSLIALACIAGCGPSALAASCKTESQLTAAERAGLVSATHSITAAVQSGNVNALQADTIPAVASDFGGIASSVQELAPMVQKATITINNVYALDASTEPAGAPTTDFYCGTPVVILHFNGLPPGNYALAIVHATGVSQPQQISLILAKTPDSRWMLAGFFAKPMIDAGHDGLWYWINARQFAQKKMDWAAWFYYRLAANLLDPVDFLSSPNLEKLHRETDQVHPTNLPGTKPLLLNADGRAYQVTNIDTSSALGALDLEVHYLPDATQANQLRDPPSARKQVLDVMTTLLALHPELHDAFHGIWVHADREDASLFSLELPMEQIAAVPPPSTTSGSLQP